MIQIEINGIKGIVLKGDSVIEASKKLNIPIPRFCYHNKLSISANCRMCLVEIEKMPKLVPACATFVVDGMKIWTRSPKAISAQKAVLEFLLINHPLDCPVCDQGGECELQDLTISYGCDRSRFIENKRVLIDNNIGNLINTDMTRCILCSRCVRFGEEIAGVVDLGIVGRGTLSRVTTFVEKIMSSELSGNIIDICPVGALTSKLFLYKARAWELRQFSTISLHDCIGSNLYGHSKDGFLMRIVPRENCDINDVWISDRDRFSYEAIYSEDRLIVPIIKKDNIWHEISLYDSLLFLVEKFKKIISLNGVNDIGILASPNSTLEEFYLLQKICRLLGINNIDHRLFENDFTKQNDFPLFSSTNTKIKDIEYSDCIFFLGSYINKEQPIVCLNINKAINNNCAKIFSIGTFNNYPFKCDFFNIVKNDNYIFDLFGIIKALENKKIVFPSSIINFIGKDYNFDYNNSFFIDDLINSKKGVFILGLSIFCSFDLSKILFLVNILCNVINFKFILMTYGSNSCGGWISGFVPHRLPFGNPAIQNGFSIFDMFSNNVKNYLLFGIEPSLDIYNGNLFINIFEKADYVAAMTVFKCKDLLSVSDLLIPICSSYESSGTFINVFGNFQSFESVEKPYKGVFPGWKVLAKLGNLFGISSCDNYISSLDILNEFKSIKKNDSISENFNIVVSNWKFDNFNNFSKVNKNNDVNFIPLLYNSDYIVRRAKSLYDVSDFIK